MKRDVNKWFPNEKPGILERILVKIFSVRLIPQDGELYIRRIYLSPLWNWLPKRIFLHHIFMSDRDGAPHDHAFGFRTFPITNWYREIIQTNSFENWSGPRHPIFKERILRVGQSAYNPATHIHRLILNKPMWTLVIADKPSRNWGFHDTWRGFVPWRKYLNMEDKAVYKDYDEDVVNG